jgi:hypothetical protein
MKNLMLLIFFLIFFKINFSQSINYNSLLQRYWNYRYALLGDAIEPTYYKWEPGFVEVGQGAGYSLPMVYRKRMEHNIISNSKTGLSNWEETYNPDPSAHGSCINQNIYPGSTNPWGPKYQGINYWVDAPTELGKYLSVLATEWELMRLNDATQNQKLQTEKEIFYALEAIDRLDMYSDGVLDGLFFRDDVPWDFARASTGCKFGCFPSPEPFGNVVAPLSHDYDYNAFENVHSAGSCFSYSATDCGEHGVSNPPRYSIESLDQLLKMVLGLVFVKKYVHATYAGVDLNLKSEQQIYRLIHYIQLNDYVVKDINGERVCRGSASRPYSYPFYKIQDKYGGGASSTHFTTVWFNKPVWTFNIFAQFYVPSATHALPLGSPFSSENALYLAVMSDAFSTSPHFPKKIGRKALWNISKSYYTKVKTKDDPYESVINTCAELMSACLNDYDSKTDWTTYENILSNAIPNGYDSYLSPWNEPYFNCEHASRFVYQNDPKTGNKPDELKYLELNGLDYMLMFNLYSLKKPNLIFDKRYDKVTRYTDIYNNTITHTFPYTSTDPFKSGEFVNDVNIQNANTLTFGSTLLPNARIHLQAPHMEFLPGFTIIPGAVLTTNPGERMDCDANFIEHIKMKSKKRMANPNMIDEEYENEENTKTSDFDKMFITKQFIKVFPNPSNDEISLDIVLLKKENCTIEVNDIYGKHIKTILSNTYLDEGETLLYLHKKDFTSGNYLVKIIIGDNVETKKICFVD